MPRFLLTDRVPDARRQRGQHREGEQGLQGAGRGQPAVGVVGGEHLAAAGVGHQPRQGGDLRETERPGTGADMGTGAVQQRGVRGRRPRPGGRTGLRPAGDVRRGGHHRQEPHRTEYTGRHGHPERESEDHMINVETDALRTATTGPNSVREHPDATPAASRHGWSRACPSARGQGRLDAPQERRVVRCLAHPLQEGLQTTLAVPVLQRAAGCTWQPTRPGAAGVPRGGCRRG